MHNTDNQSKYRYEEEAWAAGFRYVAGADEAGRGPLAGPVVTAAVILDPNQVIEGLDDSKKLSPKRREALFAEIQEKALAWSIVAASVEDIEQYNILGATKRAMTQAVLNLDPQADYALLDALVLNDLAISQEGIIKGDSLSASIAAASILAKVARDRHMLKLDALYPQYGFAKHKGYGTRQHYEALDAYGPCPEHRMLFLRSWKTKHGQD